VVDIVVFIHAKQNRLNNSRWPSCGHFDDVYQNYLHQFSHDKQNCGKMYSIVVLISFLYC